MVHEEIFASTKFKFFNYLCIFILFYFLTLQYCNGFAIDQHESGQVYTCSPSWTLLPPPSPYHLSGSSQCTSPKNPGSCIKPGLATHFICDIIRSDQTRLVAQLCPTICDPINHSMPGLPVHYQLPEFTQTHVHRVSDAIQPSHSLSSPSPLAPKPSQHQSLFQWVNSSHEVAKVLEFQLQNHSFQRNPRADLLQNGLVGSPCSPRDSQSLLQHPSSKASILRHSAFFTVHHSHP